MVKIYANAFETVAWLVRAADDSNLVLDLMHILSNYEADKDTWESAMKRHDQPGEISAYNAHLSALEAFLSRPYWGRVWTIQEMVFARQLLIYYGAAYATGIHLGTTFAAIMSLMGELRWPTISRSQASLSGTLSLSSILRLRQFILGFQALDGVWYPWKDLFFALERCNKARTTLPHDKIYAVLALAKAGSELLPAPDYSLPPEELCISTTTAILKASRDLSIICCGKYDLKTNLPSWVPNWCDSLPSTMVFHDEGDGFLDTIYMAAASSSGSFNFRAQHTGGVSKYGHILIAKNFVFDIVDGLGAVDLELNSRNNISENTDYNTIPSDQERSSFVLQGGEGLEVGVLEAFCNSLVLGRKESLSSGLGLLNSLFNTKHNHVKTDLQRQIKYLLERWYPKDTLIEVHGRIMEEWYNPAPDLTRLIRNVSDQGIRAVFYPGSGIGLETQETANHTRGHIGMAPHETEKGDKVCILLRCRVPVIMREHREGYYELVGEAYVQGTMHGELVTDENVNRLEGFQIH